MMSFQFLPRTGIEMGDSVSVGFGCGFAFATAFPVPLCSTLSIETSYDVSVRYLLIPFTMRTSETVRSRNEDSSMISMP